MNSTKMLQAILDKVTTVDKKVDGLKEDMNKRFDETNGRIDKLGKQLAYLEDDTPTMGDFEKLEKAR